MMNVIKAAIFDCDGVMFDTVKANTAYYNRVLRHFGQPEMTPAQFDFIQMHTVGESISFLFGDNESIQAAHAYRNMMGYEPFYNLMEIEPDLKPLLKKIGSRFKIAIATNRSDTIGRVLEVHGLDGYFDLVIGSLDVPRPKPHPDPLLKVTDYFNIGPHQAIYIGDSELDQQAAQAAGMPLVAYRNRSLTADAHIDRLNELEALLDSEQSLFSG
jgi:HAD superfamily hydrolase (TIGR01509 family)